MNLFRHKVLYRAALLIACVLTVPGLAVARTGVAHAASSPPATNLGIWTSAEDGGTYSTVPGQTPDVANFYLDWGSSYPQKFFSPAQKAGATAFLEIEPWIGPQGSKGCSGSGPTMTTIGANGSAIQSYAKSLGSAIASAGLPVIVTFAHEFNVSGQYPWAHGDCEHTTASQWITAWDAVRKDIDSTANGLAYFMWVPNVFNGPGGSVVNPAPYWPGASNVDMAGVDGYPQSQYNETTFANTYADTFSIIQGLSGESTIAQPKIFVAETNFSPLGSGGYESIPNMVSDICSHGGDGTLQFVGYATEPNLTSAQWSALDTAQANDCTSSPPPPGNAFTPVGGLIQGTSLTPSVTAHAVGDVILLHVTTEGSAPPTGVSGGDATWKQVGSTLTGKVNSGFSAAVYEGTVTVAGTAQATVTTSGTPSAVRIGGQEYNPGSGQTGELVSQADLDVAGTSTGPSITPTGSDELYSFYGFDTDIGSAGSTPGYTYELDNNGNVYAFDPASPTQPPGFGDSNIAFGIAVLMESAPAGSP
jgi:hypothetical protein